MFYRSIYVSFTLKKLTNLFVNITQQKNFIKLNQLNYYSSTNSLTNETSNALTQLTEIEKRKIHCDEVVEQVKQMNEYYNQYIDEYYEEFGDEDSDEIENLIENTHSKGL